jgi:hypothetical protein
LAGKSQQAKSPSYLAPMGKIKTMFLSTNEDVEIDHF